MGLSKHLIASFGDYLMVGDFVEFLRQSDAGGLMYANGNVLVECLPDGKWGAFFVSQKGKWPRDLTLAFDRVQIAWATQITKEQE